MTGEPADIGPHRHTREDRAAVAAGLLEQLPDHVAAALGGDRRALLALVQAAAGGRPRTGAATAPEVAGSAHRLADEVADCYSADRAPSGRMVDIGFALAEAVDALAAEVLHRRAEAGPDDRGALAPPRPAVTQEVRHLARAHVAALADALAAGRALSGPDVEAARELYRAVVALGRQHTALQARVARSDRGAPGDPPRG